MHSLAFLTAVQMLSAAPLSTARPPLPLPTQYMGDRFAVQPVTADGRTLTFFVDSGGGTQILWREAAEQLHVATHVVKDDGESLTLTPYPKWKEGSGIPLPAAPSVPQMIRGELTVVSREPVLAEWTDGFLGNGWLGGRTWTFDYPGHKIWLRSDGDLPAHSSEHEVKLTFRTEAGQRVNQFGKMFIDVDGERLPMLFDTGATLLLKPKAHAVLNDGQPQQRGTCFIAAGVFDRWHKAHPTWRYLENAEMTSGAAIIEVPKITLAKHDVGPVWFTRRPDKNFHQYMSSMMDKQIEGAVGGSALRYFRVHVDYPSGVAVFERP